MIKLVCTLLAIIKISLWNKNDVYIMRLKKKITWLQACFLGDMRVIWCNPLSDNHFQIYVMNNVEIVLDYYLQIIPHVSHVFTSLHTFHKLFFAKLSTWNCVWIWFGHPRLCFLWCLTQNMFKGWQKLCLWWLKILFLKFWVENKCFWKTFKLILMYFIHEIIWFQCFFA